MKQQFATIWAIIEARRTFPAAIVITGATATDDTQAIARGLAQVAHDAGQRTGFLQIGAAGSAISAAPYAALSVATRTGGREAFDAELRLWRTMYDVVIIDAGMLTTHALGAHIVRASDGVVIGICRERRAVAADRELAGLLGELRVTLIGAVLTAPLTPAQAVRVAYDRSRLEPATQP